MDKWSDQAEFTSKAKVSDLKMVDRAYAVKVTAKVIDGDKTYLLEESARGKAMGTMADARRHAEKPEPTQAQTDDFNGKLQAIFASWRQGLANGDTGPMLSAWRRRMWPCA